MAPSNDTVNRQADFQDRENKQGERITEKPCCFTAFLENPVPSKDFNIQNVKRIGCFSFRGHNTAE